MQYLGGDGSCCAQRLRWFHAIFNQQFDFARLVAVSKDADIAAVDNGDADSQCFLEAGTFAFKGGWFGLGVAAPAPITAHGLTGRQRRTERYLLVDHQPKYLGVTA